MCMSALSFLFGAHFAESNPLFERGKRCVLTTLGADGRLHTRKLKVATCSEDSRRLWFVIPAGDGIDVEIAHNPSVTVSVIDADTLSVVHLSGVATPLRERTSPLYLRPNFRQALALHVVPAEIDFMLLRVDLDPGLDLDLGNVGDRPARHSSQ